MNHQNNTHTYIFIEISNHGFVAFPDTPRHDLFIVTDTVCLYNTCINCSQFHIEFHMIYDTWIVANLITHSQPVESIQKHNSDLFKLLSASIFCHVDSIVWIIDPNSPIYSNNLIAIFISLLLSLLFLFKKIGLDIILLVSLSSRSLFSMHVQCARERRYTNVFVCKYMNITHIILILQPEFEKGNHRYPLWIDCVL